MNKIFIKRILGLIFMGNLVFIVKAQSPKDLIDKDLYDLLIRDNSLERTSYRSNEFKLEYVPNTELNKQAYSIWNKNEGLPVFVAENVYLVPKKDGMTLQKASEVLRSVSKMQGMKYYSHTSKKEKVLYKKAYTIAGPEDRTKVEDNNTGSADGKVIYALQDDSSFGKTNYKISFKQTEKELSASFVNTTPMYVGPVKAVENGNTRILFVVTDCEENFLIYMLVCAKFPALSVIENIMNESFSSRLDALYKWFVSQF